MKPPKFSAMIRHFELSLFPKIDGFFSMRNRNEDFFTYQNVVYKFDETIIYLLLKTATTINWISIDNP